MAQVQWHNVDMAPVVLLTGKEPLLIYRAVQRLKAQAIRTHEHLEIHELEAHSMTSHDLAHVTAASLFEEPRFVVIDDLAKGSDALYQAIIEYMQAPHDDVTLVLIHRGEARGKKLIDAVKRSDAPWVSAAAVKRGKEMVSFALGEFTRAQRRISDDALKALVEAYGSDLMELAAIARQLMEDTRGEDGTTAAPITIENVHALSAGRAETTGFAIADAAIAGREREALVLVRQAELAGLAPALIVGTFATKMRQIAHVSTPGARAKSLGMPEWMYRNLAREARHFSDRGLASAIEAVARADAGVKGAQRNPAWSVQNLVIQVCRARRMR